MIRYNSSSDWPDYPVMPTGIMREVLTSLKCLPGWKNAGNNAVLKESHNNKFLINFTSSGSYLIISPSDFLVQTSLHSFCTRKTEGDILPVRSLRSVLTHSVITFSNPYFSQTMCLPLLLQICPQI